MQVRCTTTIARNFLPLLTGRESPIESLCTKIKVNELTAIATEVFSSQALWVRCLHILVRLQKIAENVYLEVQCVFRLDRSIVELIFLPRQLPEK